MRSHCIMHVPFEGPGAIEKWLIDRASPPRIWPLYERPALPDPGETDFLVVMGGPMNIHEADKYPWLKDEKTFLKTCIEQGKKILGICLGAQLLADVLGANCYPGPAEEIGWFPVNLEEGLRNHPVFRHLPGTFTAFHWHGDTFDIPGKAVRIGSSEACDNQGFILNDRVLALQFHLEITPGLLRGMISNGGITKGKSPFVQTASQMIAGLSGHHDNHIILYGILESFLKDMVNEN